MRDSRRTGGGPGLLVHAQMPAAADAIVRMEELDGSLPEADGVRAFNELYLAVTRAVASDLETDGFEDPEFLADLQVAFAGRYFDAVDTSAREEEVSRAWDPLFDARAMSRVAAIQFALAGMNAHINYDLCLALEETCRARGVAPRRGAPQFRDHTRVNAILERVEAEVKDRFATGLIGVADEALGRLDDVVAIWKVAKARDAAWTNAELLWALEGKDELRESYLFTLGGVVGLSGRGLLVPVL
jgi:hypothetical protein